MDTKIEWQFHQAMVEENSGVNEKEPEAWWAADLMAILPWHTTMLLGSSHCNHLLVRPLASAAHQIQNEVKSFHDMPN